MRPRIHKKSKPVFHKIPQKVIAEYRCTVFAIDLLGKVRKHSKNNIRKCHERTAALFSKLPDDVKMVLGDVMDTDTFDKIKESGVIPKYLFDIELDSEVGTVTRGMLQKDTHLVEPSDDPAPVLNSPPDPRPVESDADVEAEEEEGAVSNLLSDVTLRQLGALHEQQKLTDQSITLREVPSLFEKSRLYLTASYRKNNDNIQEILEELHVPNEQENNSDLNIDDIPDAVNINVPEDRAGINVSNILPEGTRRRRTVRFNLPRNS
jgi:hypothetical protein